MSKRVGTSLQIAAHNWERTKGDNYIITPFAELNEKLGGGIPKVKTTVIGGQPEASKSRLLLEILWYAARKGKKALLIDIELGANEIFQRLLCAEASTSPRLIRAKDYKPFLRRIVRVSSFRILDLAGAIPFKTLRTYLKNSGAEIVGVDSLQRLAIGSNQNDPRQQVQDLMHALEFHAKSKDAAIIVTSEIKRGKEGGYTFKPDEGVSVFSESRSIEYAADVAFVLQPKKGSNRITSTDPHEKKYKINLVKNRANGVTGVLKNDIILSYPVWRIFEREVDDPKQGPVPKHLDTTQLLDVIEIDPMSTDDLRKLFKVRRERLMRELTALEEMGYICKRGSKWHKA